MLSASGPNPRPSRALGNRTGIGHEPPVLVQLQRGAVVVAVRPGAEGSDQSMSIDDGVPAERAADESP